MLVFHARYRFSDRGDHVMWLVLYVATMASLSALSFLPDLAPIPVEEKKAPYNEF